MFNAPLEIFFHSDGDIRKIIRNGAIIIIKKKLFKKNEQNNFSRHCVPTHNNNNNNNDDNTYIKTYFKNTNKNENTYSLFEIVNIFDYISEFRCTINISKKNEKNNKRK